MREKYELSLYSFWLMNANAFLIAFYLMSAIFLVMFIFSFVAWQYLGQSIKSSGVGVISIIFCVMAVLTLIGQIIKKKIENGVIKAKTRELTLQDECIIYKDKKNNEHTIYWQDITQIKLIALKMGYRVSVYSPRVKFSFSSYELDPIPLSFKEMVRQARERGKNLNRLRKQYKEKLMSLAEYQDKRKEEVKKNLLSEGGNFFRIMKILGQKSTNAVIKKDWLVRNLRGFLFNGTA